MNRKSFLFMALIAIFANACSDEDDKTTTDPGDDNPPAETPSCVSDDRQCGTDGVPELCLVDSWVKQDPCDADKKCLDGYCVPKDTKECDNGTKGCSKQGVPQICENETWKKLDACSADKHCFDGECVIQTSSVCTDGAHQCSADGVPQICQNQGWVTLDACKNHEVCNKATGACEAAAACDSERCRTMGQDQYAGNVCIQGENGTQCGCYFDEDCNDGYTCDQNLSQCTKADTPPTPQEPSEACLWHAGSYACDGDSLISCSLDGAVISREHCPSSSGSAYLGEKCILHTNDGSLSCGCNSNSDCKFGYECGSDSYCSKKECTSQACSSQSGKQYVGNVCVASYIEGVEDCGCKSNDDCKDGYTCDTVMRRCQESGQPAKSVCHDLSNGSFVCQDTEMIFCHNGNESSRVACRDMIDGEYLGNTCIDSTGICGCKNDYFCKDGLVCEDNRCVKPTCTDAACKKKSGNAYMGDVCIDDDLATTTNGKSCGCLSDTDCKSGYKCHPAMGICYAEIPQGKTGICDGICRFGG